MYHVCFLFEIYLTFSLLYWWRNRKDRIWCSGINWFTYTRLPVHFMSLGIVFCWECGNIWHMHDRILQIVVFVCFCVCVCVSLRCFWFHRYLFIFLYFASIAYCTFDLCPLFISKCIYCTKSIYNIQRSALYIMFNIYTFSNA